MTDRFIDRYLTKLHQEVREREGALARTSVDSLYSVGKLQGMIAGIELSKELLFSLLQDNEDNDFS